MKLQIADDQREFFQNNKSIEFEDILSPQEIQSLKDGILQALSKQLSIGKERIPALGAVKLFEESRDLWKHSEALQKITFHRRFGETAYQLQGQHPIRIGYDQYYPVLDQASNLNPGKYQEFLKTRATLQEISSIQGVICGVLIALKTRETPIPEGETTVFPSKAGNVVFLHPDALINWPHVLDTGGEEYYLIVYANRKSIYVRNGKDPLSGIFIQSGYATGDRLNDKKNPVIFR